MHVFRYYTKSLSELNQEKKTLKQYQRKQRAPYHAPVGCDRPTKKYVYSEVEHIIPQVELDKLENDYFMYDTPIRATINHSEFARKKHVPSAETHDDHDKTVTFAYIKAIPICCYGSDCKGCPRCQTLRCDICKANLQSKACYANCLLKGSDHSYAPAPYKTLYQYRVRFLCENREFKTVPDETLDVCAGCIHYACTNNDPICYDPDTLDCLFTLYCQSLEILFADGVNNEQAHLNDHGLFMYVNGVYKKLTDKQALKVLETYRHQDIQNEEHIVTYGLLEEAPVSNRHIFSQELDLNPSEIAALVNKSIE